MRLLAPLFAAVLLSTLFAGCSSGGSGFTITAPAAAGGEYIFKAAGSADEYVWDLGDHLTKAAGKEVRHTYDIENGKLTVKLTTVKGGVPTVTEKEVVLGSGENEAPALLAQASRYWAVTNEPFTLSTFGSIDADGDNLHVSWQCFRQEIIRVNPHDDGLPASTLQPPKQGSVIGQIANVTLPAPTLTLEGDLCDAINAHTWPSADATTIGGTFANTGLYTITLIASDGPHPTVSGAVKFYVTKPEERPNAWRHEELRATFTIGNPSPTVPVETVCEALIPDQTCSVADLDFSVPLNILGGYVNSTVVADPTGASTFEWTLLRNGNSVLTSTPETTPGTHPFVGKANTIYGAYTLLATSTAGTQLEVAISVDLHLDLNPRTVYEVKTG